MKSQWIRVTACENIPPREGRAAQIGGTEIAIFNLGDRFLAVDGLCPHQGGPLCDGIVAGNTVVCPLHAWKIGLEDGKVARPAQVDACVRTYSTRVEDGIVLIKWPGKTHADTAPDEEQAAHASGDLVVG